MDNEQAAPEAAADEASLRGGEPVGFWVRGGALFIDVGLSMVVAGGLSVALKLAGLPQLVVSLVSFVIGVAYNTFFVAAYGATIGKMAAGAEIIRPDGGRLSYPRAAGRFLAQYISMGILGIGYFMAAFTENKRALHDYIADSRVIYKESVGFGRKTTMVVLGVLCFVAPFALAGLLILAGLSNSPNAGLGAAASLSGPSGGLAEVVEKSQEGLNKGGLGSLRSSLSTYFGDNKGKYPADLQALVPKYASQIPVLKLTGRPETSDVEYYDDDVCLGSKGDQLDPGKLRNSGKWGYVRPRPGISEVKPCVGTLFVDATSLDARGKPWYSY